MDKTRHFPKQLVHQHDNESIKARLSNKNRPYYLRDVIYGAVDGIVTTFAIVAGVVGAQLSPKAILILGGANVLADGFSMAASNYLGTKSEWDERRLILEYESVQLDENPDGEKEEIREILRAKGLEDEVLEEAVRRISKNREATLSLMVNEEYGLGSVLRNPLKSAAITFVSFIGFGLIPLLPYILAHSFAFGQSVILTMMAFFCVGSLKSHWSMESWYLSGAKTLLLGSTAALLAYGAGYFLNHMVDQS